jgi:hypothetical protein
LKDGDGFASRTMRILVDRFIYQGLRHIPNSRAAPL